MHLFCNNYDQFAFVLLWEGGYKGTLKVNTPQWRGGPASSPHASDLKTLIEQWRLLWALIKQQKSFFMHSLTINESVCNASLLWIDSRSFVIVNQLWGIVKSDAAYHSCIFLGIAFWFILRFWTFNIWLIMNKQHFFH